MRGAPDKEGSVDQRSIREGHIQKNKTVTETSDTGMYKPCIAQVGGIGIQNDNRERL